MIRPIVISAAKKARQAGSSQRRSTEDTKPGMTTMSRSPAPWT